ncbi:MAG: hypothetical protein EGQ56_08465 [Clostridiales bacterium]|jgi:hypothetical protein|nr:hypothetical protein [Clostridiales bacterium]DAO26529.1 MAG TPA: hypothetical protein [Caudoviricetes sp.]
MKEKMVKILLPRGRKNEENFVIVSVNGRSWKIMRGVEVSVPEYVAEVLENGRMMAETARRYVDERAS